MRAKPGHDATLPLPRLLLYGRSGSHGRGLFLPLELLARANLGRLISPTAPRLGCPSLVSPRSQLLNACGPPRRRSSPPPTNLYSNPRGLTSFRAVSGDWRRRRSNSLEKMPPSCLRRLLQVPLDHVDAAHDARSAVGRTSITWPVRPLLAAGEHVHVVVLLIFTALLQDFRGEGDDPDVALGAQLAAHRAEMRVPLGGFCGLINTGALRSKRTTEPSGRWMSLGPGRRRP